jgi:hypothetical protein
MTLLPFQQMHFSSIWYESLQPENDNPAPSNFDLQFLVCYSTETNSKFLFSFKMEVMDNCGLPAPV